MAEGGRGRVWLWSRRGRVEATRAGWCGAQTNTDSVESRDGVRQNEAGWRGAAMQ